METILAYIFIALIMALILLFCFIMGMALIYLGEEIRYAVRKINRIAQEAWWDLEWKWNHR